MQVLLIGCGRMGSAMARGWRGSEPVLVFDPMVDAVPEGTERVETPGTVAGGAELAVVLAVKPQVFGSLGEALRPLADRGALFLSIMAGIALAGLGAALGGSGRVVRAMPNTPRSEQRRVGEESVSKCRSRGWASQ